MSRVRIEEMLAESGLAREEMTDVVDLLLPLEDLVEDAPAPSAELAALLGPARPRPVARDQRSARCRGGRAGAGPVRRRGHRPLGRRQHAAAAPAAPGLAVLPRLPALRPARAACAAPSVAGAAGADARTRSGIAAARPRGPSPDASRPVRPSPRLPRRRTPSRRPTAHATTSADRAQRRRRATRPVRPLPSPSMQPFATSSPTPSGRPHDGSGKGHPSPDPGQDDKGKGHGSDPGKGTDPGTGQGNKPGPGQRRAQPGPRAPTCPRPRRRRSPCPRCLSPTRRPRRSRCRTRCPGSTSRVSMASSVGN